MNFFKFYALIILNVFVIAGSSNAMGSYYGPGEDVPGIDSSFGLIPDDCSELVKDYGDLPISYILNYRTLKMFISEKILNNLEIAQYILIKDKFKNQEILTKRLVELVKPYSNVSHAYFDVLVKESVNKLTEKLMNKKSKKIKLSFKMVRNALEEMHKRNKQN